MNKIRFYRTAFILIMLLSIRILMSCIHCNDCIDSLSSIYHDYKHFDKDIIVFINDEMVERKDTISLTYKKVPNEYCWQTGNEVRQGGECFGLLYIYMGDYKIMYVQEGTDFEVRLNTSFYSIPLDQLHYKIDTINYYYNDSYIETKHFEIIDTSNSENIVYCKDCIVSLNNNILYYYSTVENNKIENWYLK